MSLLTKRFPTRLLFSCHLFIENLSYRLFLILDFADFKPPPPPSVISLVPQFPVLPITDSEIPGQNQMGFL